VTNHFILACNERSGQYVELATFLIHSVSLGEQDRLLFSPPSFLPSTVYSQRRANNLHSEQRRCMMLHWTSIEAMALQRPSSSMQMTSLTTKAGSRRSRLVARMLLQRPPSSKKCLQIGVRQPMELLFGFFLLSLLQMHQLTPIFVAVARPLASTTLTC